MQRYTLLPLALAFVSFLSGQVFAHCQVPCGIYDDQMRFERMLEDQKTIAKGIAQIREMASKKDAQSVNQTVRWINTKEEHASNTQKIIAEYFMTQRLKSDGENYTKKLTSAHAVMVAAMKCKQSTDPATAEALQKSIFDFYRAYTGKEPHLHDHD